MKIHEIRAVGLRGGSPEGGWSQEIAPDQCVHTLIAVLTDEGLVGYGSVFTDDALVRAALAVLEPLYRGENALEPERVSEKLHQHMFWLGRGGSITHASSRVGSTLLDLLGHGTWQPVRRALRARDPALLRERSPVRIAGGEVLTRRQSFQPWLEARALDIVQPDVTKVGGLSEERSIAWMAQEHGVKFIPHGWNTVVGLAADLHLASAFPRTALVEYLTCS